MLVSHDYKFIFIKPKKVAGTSIQEYLEPYCKNGIVKKHDPESHTTASDTRKMVGEEVWNSYLKICPTRNPWDKTVSLYFWRRRKRPFYVGLMRLLKGWPFKGQAHRYSFKDFVDFLAGRDELNIDKEIIFVDGQLPEYFFIRYENIHADMEALCAKIGIPYDPAKMPQKKVGHRTEKGYHQHYDEATAHLVKEAYAREIERFGYSY